MPKVELHVHLEGATSADTYFEIARRNNVSLETQDLPQWQKFFAFTDLTHFTAVYLQSTLCLRSPADYELMVQRFGAQQASLNVLYTEAFVACSLLPENMDSGEFLDALERGASSVARDHGVMVRFIAGISRSRASTQGEVLEIALEGRQRGIFVGLGLGGIEDGYPPRLFADTFRRARERGLHVVAHAGETFGPASVRGALNRLRVERIGHGIRSLEDPALVERLRDERIPLEICPRSNYRLGVVAADRPHPIRWLFDSGVWCTVNSDDPAMFETTLTREYETLAEQGFTWDEIWAINHGAIDATFAGEAEKLALRAIYSDFETV
ncbi:MAG TPA: adenosine deaminase [Candidatus Acidoferrales bacterium]|nr:adenosine deaminase [Candidatus Acidoferrales bacterium]